MTVSLMINWFFRVDFLVFFTNLVGFAMLAFSLFATNPNHPVELQHLLSLELGKPRYRFGLAEEEDQIGAATGLAYTTAGGDTLSIEVSLAPGKGKLTLTVKLGDVMKESAQAAFSYCYKGSWW